MKTVWKNRNELSQEDLEMVAEETGLNPIMVKILLGRGINTKQKIEDYLSEGIKNLDEIHFIHPLQEAVDRILDAIEDEQHITIYGDYDCDGTIATAILYNYLVRNGAQVDFYIPDRLSEGYGLNKKAIKSLKDKGTDLLITVDNGITAFDEIDYAKSLGMDVIVTDHHEPLSELPAADIVFDFKLLDQPYFYDICGAGAVLLLILALDQIICDPEYDQEEINQLVTIATIADVVELKNFNRDLVKCSLKSMNEEGIRNPGIRILKETAKVDEITPGTIGFRIAPMLNAAGRIGDASSIIRILTSKNQDNLNNLAQNLLSLNNDRSKIEDHILREAEEIIKRDQLDQNSILVLAKEHWHSGVIGIVASKLQEKYYKPVIIISIDNDDVGHASCRSVPGFNIVEALEDNASLLEKFGGHKQAAGFTILKENIDAFKYAVLDYAADVGIDKLADKPIYYDFELESADITENLLNDLNQCAPYGVGNPEPILKVVNANISFPRLIGKNKNHSSFKADDISCVYFNVDELDELFQPGYEFLARLRQNCYNNIQLIVIDNKLNPFLNFKAADTIINDAQNHEEFEKMIEEFGSRKMITRRFIITVFKLAQKAQQRGFYIDDFITKSGSTIVDLALALNILKEAGLLKYEYNNGVLTFDVLEPNQKADLTKTKTYSMLHS